jgi:hypothetical protein
MHNISVITNSGVFMARLMLTGILLVMLTACSNKTPDLKSPCVGAEDSPCDRRPVNDWWQRG